MNVTENYRIGACGRRTLHKPFPREDFKKNTKESVKQTCKEVEGGDKDEGINS